MKTNRFSIITSNFLLSSTMYMTNNLHTLWYHNSKQMINYGYFHVSMSLAGIIAPFVFLYSPTKNGRIFLSCSAILTAFGLFISHITHSPMISLLSGFLQGMGFSVFFLSIRNIVYCLSNKKERVSILAETFTTSNISKWLALHFSFFILTGKLSSDNSIPIVYLVAGIIASISWLPVIRSNIVVDKSSKQSKLQDLLDIFKNHKIFVYFLISSFTISGIYLSNSVIFFPIILKKVGLSGPTILLITAYSALIAALFQAFLGHAKLANYSQEGYKYSCICLGLCLIGIIFIYPFKYILIPSVFIFNILLSCTIFFRRLIELDIYPESIASKLFGLSGLFYLAGSMIGGYIGSYLISKNFLPVTFAMATFFLFLSLKLSLMIINRIVKDTTDPTSKSFLA